MPVSMRLSDQIYRQFDAHDGNWCLHKEPNESLDDFLVAEAIHFMSYHRWWTTIEIHGHCKDVTYDFISVALHRAYKCHPSQIDIHL